MDIALNEDFDVFLDDANDLATVSGRDEFEQSVAIHLTDFLYDALPDFSEGETIEQRLRLEVTRVASEHDQLDNVNEIDIQRLESRPGTFRVTVQYTTGETFDTEIES